MPNADESDPIDDRARLVGINHVGIEVGDVDEALEHYGALFDFELRGHTESKAFLDMGDQFLAIAETDRATDDDVDRHVGLVVDDASAVDRRVRRAETAFERLETSGLDVRDPWGNRFQVVDYEAVQFTKATPVLAGMGLDDLEKTTDARNELAAKGMAPNEEE